MDEHQQDANSALIELDKGLRANKVGEQCEAIVRFPSLFKRFPFPILINSAFLKLADTFRTGNNFIRLCILRVAQQSTKQLDKILNVDEFMKRIFIVIHSNDPYARALTLRMLGSVACIIGEKKNAHHSIQQGLDSHDRVEQDAAIFATTQFASHSHHFATSICNKIATMLQGLSTPLEVKLKLIPVLQFMHFDVQVSSRARGILHELLPSYPAQDFVITTLNTLTKLSLHSLVDIPSQVTLLLQYLRCDPREAVKFNSLHNLNSLAKTAPHLWTIKNSTTLCEAFSLSTLSDSLKREILQVLCTLTDSESLIEMDIEEGGAILELCRQCCYDIDVVQAALATKLFGALSQHTRNSSSTFKDSLNKEASEAAEALLILISPVCETSSEDRKALKIILPALKYLCKATTKLDSHLTEFVLSLLSDSNISLCSDVAIMLLQTLAEISLSSLSTGFLLDNQKQLIGLFQTAVKQDFLKESTVYIEKVASLLCMLLFMSEWKEMNTSTSKLLTSKLVSSKFNHWVLYKIARQASRLGQHSVASELFAKISGSVATEYHYFWLVALSDMSLAESTAWRKITPCVDQIVKKKFLNNITSSIHNYHKSQTSLMAAVTPNHNLIFQSQYIRLRRETLQAHSLLLNACNLIRTCPPAAISAIATEGGSTESKTSNGGILYTQMKSCKERFSAVNKGYSQLHMTSFDCDPNTLSNIEILQQSCSTMAYAIDLLILSRSTQAAATRQNSNFDSAVETSTDDHYTRAMKKVFGKVMGKLEQLIQSDNLALPLSHLHTDCLVQCSWMMLSVPHSYPRYFYQSLQTTNIKLAISPSQRGSNDPVTVEINQHLALKVEGVIQHSSASSAHEKETLNMNLANEVDATTRKRFRDVSKIKLVASKASQGQLKVNNSKVEEGGSSLEQVVEPHNDYFSTQFVLTFPQPGLYHAVVDTSVKDVEGVWWNTGPKETILIKAYDDNARIQQQTAQIANRSNPTRS